MKKYKEFVKLSPNHGGKIKPKFIILHHSSGSFWGGIDWILRKKSRVSYHYLIDEDGTRCQLVWDSVKAWHAGKSSWGKYSGLNGCSVGLALTGDTNIRNVRFEEIDSMAQKCIYLMDKFKIPIQRILTHAEIAPRRKDDTSSRVKMRVIARIEKIKKHPV